MPGPVHTGSLFEIEADSLRVVSVDGSRLAMRCEEIHSTETSQFVVPGKTLSEVLKLLKDERRRCLCGWGAGISCWRSTATR